jgi:hypothetical protein
MKISSCALVLTGLALALATAAPARAQNMTDSTITGLSTAFNPAISVNALLYYMGTNQKQTTDIEPGFHIQEFELQITSNVDPYFKLDATLTSNGEDFAVENLYIQTLQMPAGFQAKVGKVFVPFGLENKLHTHARPFVELPLAIASVLGPDGWGDTGALLSWMAPLPWYLELTAGGFDGSGDGLFASKNKDDYAGFGRVENLFTLNDASTFRLGGSFAWGPATLSSDTATIPEERVISQAWGVDAQLKIRPPSAQQTHALVLQGEYLEGQRMYGNGAWSDPRKGYYLLAMAQVSRMWWLQAQYDYLYEAGVFRGPGIYGPGGPPSDQVTTRWDFGIALVPTHFQSYKIEFSTTERGGKQESRVYFQINSTIGSHPAHEY